MICSKGVWDNTIPGIKFDNNGVSNYAIIQESLMKDYPQGAKGKEEWEKIVHNIKKKKKRNSNYDCIIGVSGGTDSCYLMHLAKKYDLNPLAVNLDNGWNSKIAVSNIKKVTELLNIDLETYVINYEEIKDLMRAYMRASFPWIDAPTDLAIRAILYNIASKENIKYILVGNDFRSEGKQPTEWTYSDKKQLEVIHRKYGEVKLKTYPKMSIYRHVYYGFFKKIKLLPIFNYLDYNKTNAQEKLISKYDWQYYGEHHHENLFTKFAIGYWQYEKFGIDKRKITYSAQVLSGQINRKDAIEIISKHPYSDSEIKKDIDYILNKLSIDKKEFKEIWKSENKSFKDYPSYYKIFERFYNYLWPIFSLFIPYKPKIFYEIEERKK